MGMPRSSRPFTSSSTSLKTMLRSCSAMMSMAMERVRPAWTIVAIWRKNTIFALAGTAPMRCSFSKNDSPAPLLPTSRPPAVAAFMESTKSPFSRRA